jgi:mono/diheme cytochrome c family protein
LGGNIAVAVEIVISTVNEMKRSVWIALILLAGVSPAVFAAATHLNEQQKLGRRLFEQSCGVCHTKPTLIAGTYGPELSRATLGGRQDLIATFISNGTERMPGFKYTYNAAQIAAIAAYIKTLPPGTQNTPTTHASEKAPVPVR